MRSLTIAIMVMGCGAPCPPCPVAETSAPSIPAPSIPATFSAQVCVHCTGPAIVDRDGHGFALIHVAVEASAAITELRLTGLELLDDQGALITHGTPRPEVGMTTDPPARDLGPFDGHVAAGARVVLWTTAQLDVQDTALDQLHPTRYRLRLTAAGGASLELAGLMLVAGATG